MSTCTTGTNCKSTNAVSVGCINFLLREGNYREFKLTFRKITNPNTIDEIIEPIDLSLFQEIVMDIKDAQTEEIILIKEIGNGLRIDNVDSNILYLYFGKETFDLGRKNLKYDIYFITDDTVGNTYVEGKIKIESVITKRLV